MPKNEHAADFADDEVELRGRRLVEACTDYAIFLLDPQGTMAAMGSLGMRERASQFGGSRKILGTEGHGTQATVRMPA